MAPVPAYIYPLFICIPRRSRVGSISINCKLPQRNMTIAARSSHVLRVGGEAHLGQAGTVVRHAEMRAECSNVVQPCSVKDFQIAAREPNRQVPPVGIKCQAVRAPLGRVEWTNHQQPLFFVVPELQGARVATHCELREKRVRSKPVDGIIQALHEQSSSPPLWHDFLK